MVRHSKQSVCNISDHRVIGAGPDSGETQQAVSVQYIRPLSNRAGPGSGETQQAVCAMHYTTRLWEQALAVVRHSKQSVYNGLYH